MILEHRRPTFAGPDHVSYNKFWERGRLRWHAYLERKPMANGTVNTYRHVVVSYDRPCGQEVEVVLYMTPAMNFMTAVSVAEGIVCALDMFASMGLFVHAPSVGAMDGLWRVAQSYGLELHVDERANRIAFVFTEPE